MTLLTEVFGFFTRTLKFFHCKSLRMQIVLLFMAVWVFSLSLPIGGRCTLQSGAGLWAVKPGLFRDCVMSQHFQDSFSITFVRPSLWRIWHDLSMETKEIHQGGYVISRVRIYLANFQCHLTAKALNYAMITMYFYSCRFVQIGQGESRSICPARRSLLSIFILFAIWLMRGQITSLRSPWAETVEDQERQNIAQCSNSTSKKHLLSTNQYFVAKTQTDVHVSWPVRWQSRTCAKHSSGSTATPRFIVLWNEGTTKLRGVKRSSMNLNIVCRVLPGGIMYHLLFVSF